MSGQINLDVSVSVCAKDCKLLQAVWWSARGNCMKDAETFYYSERTTLKKKSMHLRVQQTLSYKGGSKYPLWAYVKEHCSVLLEEYPSSQY
jgi:hypothetical protein